MERIILILVLVSCAASQSVFVMMAKNTSIPPKTNNRTAVLISGQLRSGNLTWWSDGIKKDYAVKYFGPEDPPTPIATMLEWVIRPLAEYGGVDLFIFVQLGPNSTLTSSLHWNGDPMTFEPTYHDITMCKLYSDHALFTPITGNRVFCITEYEKELSTPFSNSFKFWQDYYYSHIPLAKEALLQQLYGMYRANLAAKQVALVDSFTYTYKLRIRPDLAAVREFPTLDKLKFKAFSDDCQSTIFYPTLLTFRLGGAEDSFNIGLAEDMDRLLDRYVDITSTEFIKSRCKYNKHVWCAESYLISLLKERYGICLRENSEIWVSNIRRIDHTLRFNNLSNSNHWRQIDTAAL